MKSLYKVLIGSAVTAGIIVSSVMLSRYGAGDTGKYTGEPETDIMGITENLEEPDVIASADRIIEGMEKVNEIMERNTNELISRLNKNRDEIISRLNNKE